MPPAWRNQKAWLCISTASPLCPTLLCAWHAAMQPQLAQLPQMALADALWALARLQQVPEPQWMEALQQAVDGQLQQLDAQVGGVVHWGDRGSRAGRCCSTCLSRCG